MTQLAIITEQQQQKSIDQQPMQHFFLTSLKQHKQNIHHYQDLSANPKKYFGHS
jgi:hypothetical protein